MAKLAKAGANRSHIGQNTWLRYCHEMLKHKFNGNNNDCKYEKANCSWQTKV